MAGTRGRCSGYQVRRNKRTEATKLLFCTTGIALRMMLSETPLDGISHVVVDEVHEKTRRPTCCCCCSASAADASQPPVVLMARRCGRVPTKYFGDCEVLNAKGRTFPVEEYHLEQALDDGQALLRCRRLRASSSTIASSCRADDGLKDAVDDQLRHRREQFVRQSSTQTTRDRGSRRMCTAFEAAQRSVSTSMIQQLMPHRRRACGGARLPPRPPRPRPALGASADRRFAGVAVALSSARRLAAEQQAVQGCPAWRW